MEDKTNTITRETQMRKREIVSKGDKFGKLTVITDPYHMPEPNGHRRQHVDCECACGKVRLMINSAYLKRGSVIYYCGQDCPIYQQDYPLVATVPTESKILSKGFKIHKLTVVREAFYHKQKGEANRHKCVEVKCECGNTKIYREDKLAKGAYKSCGCSWERKKPSGEKKRCIKCKHKSDSAFFKGNICDKCLRSHYLLKTYGLNVDEFNELLKKQNNKCAICKSADSKTHKTPHFHVDHCHKTGKVRGLLCDRCNIGVGAFEDNPKFLQSAIKYLS